MPYKKGKKKTTPKHKKNDVKLIAKHKICTDNQPTYKKRKNITNIPKKGNVAQESLMQKNNKKRRLPVEVMPRSNDNVDCVRVIDNLPELKPFNTTIVNSVNTSISIANLTQAKKIREQVWIHHNGKKFETKCYVTWCTNKVDVFNFQVGHDTPKAHGGSNELLNLKPICQNCNQSMGSRYSIAEWNQLFVAQRRQISTMIDRRYSEPDAIAILPIEYKKIDLSSNIFVKQQPSNIIQEPVIMLPQITKVPEMQTENMQTKPGQHRNMYYGPLVRLMPGRANRPVIVQSALGVMVLVGAWIFCA